jgi:hypothetical protein
MEVATVTVPFACGRQLQWADVVPHLKTLKDERARQLTHVLVQEKGAHPRDTPMVRGAGPMKIDTSMGKFEFFSDQSGIGAELKSAMKTDSEFDKSYLVNKYANFKNKMANPTPNASKDDDYF